MAGYHATVDKIGILMEVRRNQDKYTPIWAARCAMIAENPLKQTTYDNYPSDYPTATSRSVIDYVKQVDTQLVAQHQ